MSFEELENHGDSTDHSEIIDYLCKKNMSKQSIRFYKDYEVRAVWDEEKK